MDKENIGLTSSNRVTFVWDATGSIPARQSASGKPQTHDPRQCPTPTVHKREVHTTGPPWRTCILRNSGPDLTCRVRPARLCCGLLCR
jgi:hypothetical protein